MSKIEFQDFFNIHKFTYTDKKEIDKMKLDHLSNEKKNNTSQKSDKSDHQSSNTKDYRKR